ncbi:MAG: restriction endonuclease subunit S [Candidatus Riflebacteria bacterium]|nr:restriction endonuclease subunit S [Candidatus Riflebacteria bacterium]
MANDWRESTWGEEISLEYGKALRDYDTVSGKFRVFGSNGPIGWTSQPLAPGPGVILGRKGAYRGVEFSWTPFFVIDTAYYVVPKTELDMRWLYYAIKYHKLGEIDDGSPIPSTTRAAVYVRDLHVPSLAEQKAIAHILGALDEKIELNRKMNATLEGMSRALFQSWFVDFDPVRAKLDGRSPAGMDEVTADLFPASFQDSALGHIPQGWTAGCIGDIATNPKRGIQPSYIAANTPYIALEHMPRRCIALGDWDDSADVASGKSIFHRGEILFGKLRPYFHKVGVAPIDGVCSTDILVLAPRNPEWFGFLLGHVSSDAVVYFTDLASTGTKMPRTSWGDISSFKVTLPPRPIAAAFTKAIESTIEHIIASVHQSRTLATVRDTLLPKLLSGELRVTDADHIVSEVI